MNKRQSKDHLGIDTMVIRMNSGLRNSLRSSLWYSLMLYSQVLDACQPWIECIRTKARLLLLG